MDLLFFLLITPLVLTLAALVMLGVVLYQRSQDRGERRAFEKEMRKIAITQARMLVIPHLKGLYSLLGPNDKVLKREIFSYRTLDVPYDSYFRIYHPKEGELRVELCAPDGGIINETRYTDGGGVDPVRGEKSIAYWEQLLNTICAPPKEYGFKKK